MTDALVRFGIAMPQGLLADLDALAAARGATRSEVLRDLVRGEVASSRTRDRTPAVGTLTMVYDHHVRELSERLTDMQHDLGEAVRSTLHVHLDHDRCLEVLVLRGRADELRAAADRILATKGVLHGRLELVPDEAERANKAKRPHSPHGKHGR